MGLYTSAVTTQLIAILMTLNGSSVGTITVTGRYPLGGERIRRGDQIKVFIRQLYTFDETSTELVTNKALDQSGLYYI